MKTLSSNYWRGGMMSALLFTTVAMLTAGAVNGQADPVIDNADFEETIPGTNKPADWSDVGSNALALNNDGGRLNLNLPNAARTLGPTTFRAAEQSVDLTGVQYLTFDAGATISAPNWVRATVRIDGNVVWSTAVAGSFPGQVIDVSAYPGVRTLSLRIESIVSAVTAKPAGVSANFNFDNLRTVSPDTTAPLVAVAAANGLLWPPNHQLMNVGLDVDVEDDRDEAPDIAVFVYSNEPDNGAGDGDTDGDVVVGADGSVSVRAERSGQGAGRVYLIVVAAKDEAGNIGYDCTTVVVPKSKSKKDVEAAAAAAAAAESIFLDTEAPPAGWHLLH